MKRLLCILLSVCLLYMSGCSKSGSITDEISKTIGIDLANAEYATRIDTHGGFHGDGNTIVTMPVSNESVLEQIQSNSNWHSLPFTGLLLCMVSQRAPLLSDRILRLTILEIPQYLRLPTGTISSSTDTAKAQILTTIPMFCRGHLSI